MLAVLCAATSIPIPVGAISAKERDAIRGNYPRWAELDFACGEASTPSLAEGKYALPATRGFTGYEEPINELGQVPSTGNAVTFAQHAALGRAYRDYYITMRWTSFKWYWGGAEPTAPNPVLVDAEQRNWMAAEPRMVLVTNPRTSKSIIAVALESGPAPWTGIDTSKNNDAKGSWQQPQLGTPADYKGRVAGFPPKAIDELGAVQRTGGKQDGDELLYAWAPPGSTPGPTNLRVDTLTSSGTGTCGAGGLGVSPDGFVFPLQTTKAKLKNNPYWTPTCKNKVSRMGSLGTTTQIKGLCHHDYLAADIQTAAGTTVVAPRPGRVIRNGYSAFNCIFNNLSLYSDPALGGDGNTYYFAHLSSDKLAKGSVVKAGDKIGTINPANCFLPHLHIDISPIQAGFIRGSFGTGGPLLDPQPALSASYENLPEN